MSPKIITIDELSERLSEIDEEISHALQAVEGDRGSSPVLKAVVEQFQEKCKKTVSAMDEGDEESMSEHIVELEQAGDSAKVAAQADSGIAESTRSLVIAAHDSICELKSEVMQVEASQD